MAREAAPPRRGGAGAAAPASCRGPRAPPGNCAHPRRRNAVVRAGARPSCPPSSETVTRAVISTRPLAGIGVSASPERTRRQAGPASRRHHPEWTGQIRGPRAAASPVPAPSSRPPPQQHHLGRGQQAHQVEEQRGVLDVVEVVLELDRAFSSMVEPYPYLSCAHPVMPGFTSSRSANSGPARLELVEEHRPLRARPHQAHVAPQHVPELGQLVEPRAPEEPAHRQDPRVSPRSPRPPPACSASRRMVRNFHIRYSRPPRPIRSCEYSTGLPSVSQMTSATAAITGAAPPAAPSDATRSSDSLPGPRPARRPGTPRRR